ncbi:MAG: hypothetical protein E7578_00910 [Ruminococcaceae bacterium]|nr:hypothetical protein [Oscillospiraceae bacterium]
MKIRFIALALVFVLTAGMLIACSKDDNGGKNDDAKATGSEYTGTGETLELPEVTFDTASGDKPDIDAFYEEQYKNMTPDEIAQFEQDLRDLGITKEELFNLMYYSDAPETAAPDEETSSGETTAAETSAK